jgi:hypothetical protein
LCHQIGKKEHIGKTLYDVPFKQEVSLAIPMNNATSNYADFKGVSFMS